MPAKNVTINEKQLAVLRWIADGSPDGVMADYTHRISAVALRARSLVTISGRGNTWTAQITPEGRALLDSQGRPTAHAPDAAARRSDTTGLPDRLPVAEQLVADVIAAGGTLRVPDETAAGGVSYRQRAYAAQRFGKVPPGKHLTVSRRDGEFEIRLRDGAPASEPDGTSEVPVPARVSRYHPVARQFRDRTQIHEVSRAALPRAVRIVQALCVEAERRGHTIACAEPRRGERGRQAWSGATDGQLHVTISGHTYRLRITEKGVGQRGPWERIRHAREEDPFGWRRSRPEAYDKHATGQLDITLDGYARSGRPARWGDRKRWKLEDRLGNLLHELDTRAAEDEQRRIDADREREERQRRWEAAVERAKHAFVADHRIKVLRARVQAWQEADAIRAYCDAVEERHGSDLIDDPDAAAWIILAREHADLAQGLPTMPADPEPSREDLRAYLGGLSPYEPLR